VASRASDDAIAARTTARQFQVFSLPSQACVTAMFETMIVLLVRFHGCPRVFLLKATVLSVARVAVTVFPCVVHADDNDTCDSVDSGPPPLSDWPDSSRPCMGFLWCACACSAACGTTLAAALALGFEAFVELPSRAREHPTVLVEPNNCAQELVATVSALNSQIE
jgi:hypothetical protein